MSTIKVDTIATRTGSGNITVSNNAVLSGDLTVDTSVLKVDATNNRVGVGTASPTSDLHVSGGAGAHVAIQSSAGSHWRLGDAVGSSNGIFVVRDHTNSANRIQILADGKTQIAQGVTFGSDTAQANTLDDFEEGTWTAGISAASGSIALQSSFQTGLYTKIGDMVYVNLHMRVGALSGNSGTLAITGLPFATPNDTNYRFSGACAAHFGLQNLGAGDRLMPYLSSNSSQMNISNANGNSISSNSNSYMVANQSEMYLTMTYKTS